MDTAFTFSDVLIKPKYSEIISRAHIDLTSTFGPEVIKLPVMSANMKDVTGPKMAVAMAEYGAVGTLHRFNDIETSVQDFKDFYELAQHDILEKGLKNLPYNMPVVSIGVQEEDKKRFDALYEAGARLYCIDVAHGHHILVKQMINWIRNKDLLSVTIIAGNIATGEAAYDLADWGAKIVKVGIGPGAVCRTRQRTGVGVPQLQALEDVRNEINQYNLKIQVIADGGIKEIGDIPKCLKYANIVMIGSVISGTSETPGRVFTNPEGQFYKIYGGSASGENKKDNRFVEGMVKMVPFRGHVKYILREIEDGIRSAYSYVGARNLEEFQKNCEFVNMTNNGAQESKI
jgi:IMP dehydrogenase